MARTLTTSQRANARARYAPRGNYAASGGAYLFFCGSVIFAVALLTLSSFILPPRALQPPEFKRHEMQMGMIQLMPARDGLCRQFVFHNDSGRFEEGGSGPCRGPNDRELQAEIARERRNDALHRAFKFR